MSTEGMNESAAKRRRLARGSAALALLLTVWTPADAQLRTSQQRVADPGGTQFDVQLLRPSGGPVVPIFEGWYRNPNGSYELTFGYFNVNTEDVVEIPLGPDNFIEPAEFDGIQPTHFLPSPEDVHRYYGVFTVTVPASFGSRDVVWTLRVGGQTLSVPGRVTRAPYELAGWATADGVDSAPVLRMEATGPEQRGMTGRTIGPLGARVGDPLPLTIWATRDDGFGSDTRPIALDWFKHQGPGRVAFSEQRHRIEPEDWAMATGWGQRTTEATFDEPGEYVLRVVAYNGEGQWSSHCCWTNGYVKVTVTPR